MYKYGFYVLGVFPVIAKHRKTKLFGSLYANEDLPQQSKLTNLDKRIGAPARNKPSHSIPLILLLV